MCKITYNGIKYTQLVTDKCLSHLHERFKKKYSLVDYTSVNESTIFFGLYNLDSIQKLQTHRGFKCVIFGGTDVELIKQNLKMHIKLNKIDVNVYFALSMNIYIRLNNYKIGVETQRETLDLNLVDEQLFNPKRLIELRTEYFIKPKSIFVYNGLSAGNEDTYGKVYYEQIVRYYEKQEPGIEFIFSNSLGIRYEQMPLVYAKCFIGLRLTENDGSANMVQEMVSMGLPVVHNGEQGGLEWNSLKDVVNIIDKYWALVTQS